MGIGTDGLHRQLVRLGVALLTAFFALGGAGAYAATSKVAVPAVTAVDGNNVDLIGGQWRMPAPSLSIGVEGSGLSNSFGGFAAFQASTWSGSFRLTTDGLYGAVLGAVVTVGDKAESFGLDGGVNYTPSGGGASTLHAESDFMVYTTGDGDRYYFDKTVQSYSDRDVADPGQPIPPMGLPIPQDGEWALTKVVKADGEVITLKLNVGWGDLTYTIEPFFNSSWNCRYGDFTFPLGVYSYQTCPPCDESGAIDYEALELMYPDLEFISGGCDGEWGGGEFRLRSQSVELKGVTSSLGWTLAFTSPGGLTTGAVAFNASSYYCDVLVITACDSAPGLGMTSSVSSPGGVHTVVFTDASGRTTTSRVTYGAKIYKPLEPGLITDYRAWFGYALSQSVETGRGVLGEATYTISTCGVDYDQSPTWRTGSDRSRVSSYAVGGSTWTYGYTCTHNTDNSYTITATVTDPGGGVRTVVARWFQEVVKITSDTDALGRTTSYEYDTAGRLTKVVRPGGNTSTGGYTAYSYNSQSDVIEVREVPVGGAGTPSSHLVTAATYAACDAQTATNSNFRYCHKPLTVTDADGVVTTWTYAYQHGGVLTETGPAVGGVAAQVRYAYDQFTPQVKNSGGTLVNQPQVWRLVSTKSCMVSHLSCAGTADEAVVEIGYTGPNVLPVTKTVKRGDGTLVQAITTAYNDYGDVTSVDGAQSGTADTAYVFFDAARRKVGEIGADPDGGGSRTRKAVRTSYGPDGQVEAVETGYTSGTDASALSGMTVLDKSTTAYSSTTGKPVVERRYDGSTVTAVVQKSYDTLLRLDCAAQRMNASAWGSLPTGSTAGCTLQTAGSDGPDRIVKTTYDLTGAVLKTTSGYGVSGQQRDDRVNIYSSTDGTLTSAADGNGNLTTYEYDAHLRRVKTRYPNATGGGSSTTDYEEATYTGGRITSLRTRDGQTITTSYDAAGRVSAQGGAVAESFAYDNLGKVTSHTRGGVTSTFTFNSLGWLASEASAIGTVSYGYDAYGRRDTLTWPDSFAVTYDYDVTGQVTAIKKSGSAIASFTYDNLGRRTAITRPNGVTTAYGYDTASRLTSLGQDMVTGTDLTAGFVYNAASQLKTRTANAMTYEPAAVPTATRNYGVNGLNQMTTSGSLTLTYDGRGNTTSDGVNTYTYDVENRLTGLSGGASLTYDAQGRLYQVAGSATTRFLYDGVNLIGEYDGSNAVQRRYVHGPGTDEPLVWYEGSGTSDTRHLVQNQQGSVIAVTNSSGASIATNTYDEYGVPGSSNSGRFQYTGQTWLPEVGLYYYKARMYAPSLGKFLQTDPIGYRDGMNIYAYVGNDPVNGVDPSGEQVFKREDGRRVIVVYPETTHRHVAARHSPDAVGPQSKFAVPLTYEQGQGMAARSIETARRQESVGREGTATVYEGKVGGPLTSAGSRGEDTVRVVTQPLTAIRDPRVLNEVAEQLGKKETVAMVAALAATDGLGAKPPAVEVVVTQYPIEEKNRTTRR